MPRTLLQFFADEAMEYLNRMDATVQAPGELNADELRRFARALRGSARMADQDAIARSAGAVQSLAVDLGAGRRHWTPELKATLRSALDELRQMVTSVQAPPPDLARRAEALARELGESAPPSPPPPKDDERFRRYLGTELRGLASDIGDSLVILERDPRNREPLKRLLRRVRPLRGIEGIDQIPAVGPALAAVEEVILRIADTSATVGPGHLVLFRRARQALEDVAVELIRGESPKAPMGGSEIEDLKDQVLGTAAQREITWISELFPDGPGPHIEDCPMAERGAGSWEAFFDLEATGSLDTIERLRADMARSPQDAPRLGERLAYTFRQLRERAVTFGHAELGRVARRAGAAVRVALDGAPEQVQALGVDLALPVSGLRTYLTAETDQERARALENAENSLELATQPSRTAVVPIESLLYTPTDAVARARELSRELEELLARTEPNFSRASALLREAVSLLGEALQEDDSKR